ncbi:MAG: acylphosphatase [Planctomycetota bacterium]|jgi:acylphosphatase
MNHSVARVAFLVRGRVQGVGFRYFVCSAAEKLGLVGWVRNNPDSSVEGELQGGESALAEITSLLEKGPRWSRVEGVSIQSRPLREDPEAGVEIRRP